MESFPLIVELQYRALPACTGRFVERDEHRVAACHRPIYDS